MSAPANKRPHIPSAIFTCSFPPLQTQSTNKLPPIIICSAVVSRWATFYIFTIIHLTPHKCKLFSLLAWQCVFNYLRYILHITYPNAPDISSSSASTASTGRKLPIISVKASSSKCARQPRCLRKLVWEETYQFIS